MFNLTNKLYDWSSVEGYKNDNSGIEKNGNIYIIKTNFLANLQWDNKYSDSMTLA